MNHEEIRQQLWALYDGQLTEAEKVPWDSHLRDCAECRLLLSEWKNAAQTLFPIPDLPDATGELFVQRVMARVHDLPELQPASGWKSFLPWAAPVLGSAALAAWVFFFVLPGTPGLSTGTALEDFFPSDSAALASPALGEPAAESSAEEFVQVLVKE
jgi:anti-sigma factor RsiW